MGIARSYLNDIAKSARDQIEALLTNKGVALAASADDCRDTNKNAERKAASETACACVRPKPFAKPRSRNFENKSWCWIQVELRLVVLH